MLLLASTRAAGDISAVFVCVCAFLLVGFFFKYQDAAVGSVGGRLMTEVVDG
ncbi:hypothetical protein BDP55DRAFT_661514 [Colletotrichum godetiae]|uniref:Uncharacterized protein n=1 Tax=Colletotrichum godetiae TaxID=1209918 RepID=A0AAJ0ARQ1_9PEZI|nr:uncharacterized protein BDP55DRAFT_661514 [Colletotrichum godetiae]KAK1676576.1 hypothetical protein BDP55DRAFT_661514 [Colletotrichum godetiae]